MVRYILIYPNLPRVRAWEAVIYIYISILYCPLYTKSGHLVYSV